MDHFTPQSVQRNRCATCGTLRHAHAQDGACPRMYRPDTLEAATAALRAAQGDPVAEFVARGDVQRLGGKPDDAA
jgi:hypothetical protein